MRIDLATQANQKVSIKSPLGDDALLFRSMDADEKLSTLFSIELELLSDNLEINLDDILGQNVTVTVERVDGEPRFFNGIVSHFAQAGSVGEYARYRATLRPWFWFLTRTADCRIFQEMTVPDIVTSVLRDCGFTDFENSLSGSYRNWNYCVQYRETDYQFISRLLEHEGIYYYFKHEDGKHVLVLSDSISAHNTTPGYAEVPYFPPQQSDRRERDHINDWHLKREVQPGTYALNAFDFEKPKADLSALQTVTRQHEKSDYEVYDYPGAYIESGDGNAYVKARIEELQAQHEIASGSGNVNGLMTGALFTLADYPRADQNIEYLVTSTMISLGPLEYESGRVSNDPEMQCRFTAINRETPFRPARVTPKPFVKGPQTAIVVGKAGEEIWTDKYGRVKVQFHWDRYGEANEKSSCWVRVAQLWAGNSWGGIHIPRIGQEVIVEFLEGDPDRPIVTGRVYNFDNMPPYELPDNATQSGIKSRSTKGGNPNNFNEFRFEDKIGEEQIYIHAEKNQDNVVENDETTEVGHDRTENIGNDETITIGNDRVESVGNDETITIGANRTESVGANESISIGENRTEDVGNDESITIGSNRSKSVGDSESITIAKNRTANVGKDESVTISDDKTESIGKDASLSIGKNSTVSVGDDQEISIGKNLSISVGKKVVIDAGDSLTLNCGKASIILKKNGTIQLSGKDINVKASGNIKMKGSKIAQN